MGRVYNRTHLTWRQSGGTRELCLGRTTKARVVPDDKYPGMWRVSCDGRLSDMANLTRAKDAACSIVLASVNVEETGSEAPYRRSPGRRAARVAGTPRNGSTAEVRP
jgi:hypothetical protein